MSVRNRFSTLPALRVFGSMPVFGRDVQGWSTFDYALATAFVAPILALAPFLMVPPLLVTALMPPRG